MSDKKPKKKQGLIKGDMKKGRNGSYLLLKTNDNPAITQFFSVSIAPNLRLFLLKPHSGKTHQLRVAMKSLGSPIIGDKRYGSNNQDSPNSSHDDNIGQLHAWQLSFLLNDKEYSFEALPQWDNKLIQHWLAANKEIECFNWPKV